MRRLLHVPFPLLTACLSPHGSDSGTFEGQPRSVDSITTSSTAPARGRGWVPPVSLAGPPSLAPSRSIPTRSLTTAGDDWFGSAVSQAGDVNGDGFDDILVGAPIWGSDPALPHGRAHIFHGSASGVGGSASRILEGAAPGERLGERVSGAGDVDADGYDDVLVTTAQYATVPPTFRVHLYRGTPLGIGATAALSLSATTPGDEFGVSVSEAGDLDADGFADVLVSGTSDGVAAVYVYFGAPTGLDPVPTLLIPDPSVAGTSLVVAGAGDVDGDRTRAEVPRALRLCSS
jgi:hypothetical protein